MSRLLEVAESGQRRSGVLPLVWSDNNDYQFGLDCGRSARLAVQADGGRLVHRRVSGGESQRRALLVPLEHWAALCHLFHLFERLLRPKIWPEDKSVAGRSQGHHEKAHTNKRMGVYYHFQLRLVRGMIWWPVERGSRERERELR